MEKSVERTQRTFIRLLLGGLIAIVLLIGGVWGGRDLYYRWQEKRLLRRAYVDIGHGDVGDASLAARTILEMNPFSASASRIMAELAERAGERAALDWRRKVAQVDPHSVDDALALVRCAVRFKEIEIAERALQAVDENGLNTAPYHEAAALVAQAKHQDDKAETEWAEALRLKPGDAAFQLQLGILRARSSDPTKFASGEALLDGLRSDPNQRAAAARALINASAMRKDDPRKFIEVARELQAYPEATWNDRLVYLDFLRVLQDPQFTAYLTQLEKTAPDKAPMLALLISWMSRNNLNLVAIDYIKSLSEESLQKWPVPMAVADVHIQLHDWSDLEKMTAKGQWGRFEFLRYAYLARALREQGKAVEAERNWATAAKQVSEQPDLLSLLIQTAAEWKWEDETIALLWSLSKHPEKQKEAFLALYRNYAKASDTQGLYRVLVRLSEVDANNLDLQNNLAQVSLLLDINPTEARKLALDVYHKSPNNPAYLTAYAYSLLTQGNPKEALRIMRSLNEEQLSDPTISTYYGILLAANGDQKARPYLEFGKKANLLPEEKALVDKAFASLNWQNRTR